MSQPQLTETERVAPFDTFTPFLDAELDDTHSAEDDQQDGGEDEKGCYPLTRCPTRSCSTCAMAAT